MPKMSPVDCWGWNVMGRGASSGALRVACSFFLVCLWIGATQRVEAHEESLEKRVQQIERRIVELRTHAKRTQDQLQRIEGLLRALVERDAKTAPKADRAASSDGHRQSERGSPASQPESTPRAKRDLPEMPTNDQQRAQEQKGARMKPAAKISSDAVRAGKGAMPPRGQITVPAHEGPQLAPTTVRVDSKSKHLRLRLRWDKGRFVALSAAVRNGAVRQKTRLNGDFVVALTEGKRVLHVLSRQDPLLEHPFHHERDIRGEFPTGPVRVRKSGSSAAFTISLPFDYDLDRLAKLRVEFYVYAPKRGSKVPAVLDVKSFRRWKSHLKPAGALEGKVIVPYLRESKK